MTTHRTRVRTPRTTSRSAARPPASDTTTTAPDDDTGTHDPAETRLRLRAAAARGDDILGDEDDAPAPARRRRRPSRTRRTRAADDSDRGRGDDDGDDEAPTRRRRPPASSRARSKRSKKDAEADAAPRRRPRRARSSRGRPDDGGDGEDETASATRKRPSRRSARTSRSTPSRAKAQRDKDVDDYDDESRPARSRRKRPERTRSGSRSGSTTNSRGSSTRTARRTGRGGAAAAAPKPDAPAKPIREELIASVNPRESRIALLEDGKVVEFMIDRPDTQNLVGSIILGRVDSVVPGIEAAFVDIGLEKNGFLYVQDVIGSPGDYDILESLEQDARPRRYQRNTINKLLKKDQTVVVQVKKEPMGGKGTRLTSYLTLPGRYSVLMPNVAQVGVSRKIQSDKERDRLRKIVRRIRPKGMGLILRTAAIGAHEDDIEADVEHLTGLWDRIQELQKQSKPPTVLHQDMTGVLRATREVFTDDVRRFLIDNRSAHEAVRNYLSHMGPHLLDRVEFYDDEVPLFEKFKLDQEMDRALDTRVPLPSGGYLLIDQTEAVVTIDINTGSYTGSKRLEETVYHTNLEAVDEVARQLRLRDLGGIILIDFIDMESAAYRRDVYKKLLQALERDRSKTRVQEMSELCIVQLTRKRTKYSLQKTLCSPCPTCNGRGVLRSATTLALHILHEIETKTRNLAVEHVLVEAHATILDFLSHQFAYELQDLENYIETLILLHPVDDRGHEYTKVIVEGKPLDAEGTARRRRRRGSRGGRGRRNGGRATAAESDAG